MLFVKHGAVIVITWTSRGAGRPATTDDFN